MMAIFFVLLVLFSIAAIAIFGTITRASRIHHARAIQTWTRYLPAVALAYYLASLLASIFKSQFEVFKLGYLALPFKPLESCVLLTLTLLYLTRHANLVALATIVFTAIHSLTKGYRLDHPTVVLFLMSSMILLFLGDKAFWSPVKAGGHQFGHACRRLGMGILAAGAMATLILALFKVVEMRLWLEDVLKMRMSKFIVSTLLIALITGWMSIGIRSLRPFMMPLLALPTLMVTVAMANIHHSVAVILFLMTLSLAWSTSERRSLRGHQFDGPISRRIS